MSTVQTFKTLSSSPGEATFSGEVATIGADLAKRAIHAILPDEIEPLVDDAIDRLPSLVLTSKDLQTKTVHGPDHGDPAKAAEPPPPPSKTPENLSPAALAFINLPADELMKRVRTGDIPPAVLESDGALRALQANIAHIAEMNSLLSQMLSSIHQMNMAVIQN